MNKISKEKIQKIIYIGIIIITSFVVGLSLQLVHAWIEPTLTAPNGNLGAPINTSATTQTKSGALYVNGGIVTPLIWDLNNTAYYLDPSNTSNLNIIQASIFYYSSDRNLKENILPLNNSLDKILQLQGVSFYWKDKNKGSNQNIGLIAQDVEKVYPELVGTNPATGMKSVEYGNLVAPLIEAIKEQENKIKTLQAEINNLKK